MRVEFADDDVARICTDEAHRMGLPFAVIKAARRKLIQMEAARDERDMRNLKGLNYKKLHGPRGDNDRSGSTINIESYLRCLTGRIRLSSP